MRTLLILIILFVSGCATTSQMESVEQRITDGQNTITSLDQKITQLESDKEALQKQLQFVEGEQSSEAIGIREKIALIDDSINGYKQEIVTINSFLEEHSAQIKTVSDQQSKQKAALAEALKKNAELKQQATNEIIALEKEYEARRKKEDNPDEGK